MWVGACEEALGGALFMFWEHGLCSGSMLYVLVACFMSEHGICLGRV